MATWLPKHILIKVCQYIHVCYLRQLLFNSQSKLLNFFTILTNFLLSSLCRQFTFLASCLLLPIFFVAWPYFFTYWLYFNVENLVYMQCCKLRWTNPISSIEDQRIINKSICVTSGYLFVIVRNNGLEALCRNSGNGRNFERLRPQKKVYKWPRRTLARMEWNLLIGRDLRS